jgi:hypothetical protein
LDVTQALRFRSRHAQDGSNDDIDRIGSRLPNYNNFTAEWWL